MEQLKEQTIQSIQSSRGAAVKTRIKVIGIGGAGCNIVSRMQETLAKFSRDTADDNANGYNGNSQHQTPASSIALTFAAVATDAQALENCRVHQRLQIGVRVTHGLSAGGDPFVGKAAAEDSVNDLRALTKGLDIAIIVAGLGGGTGGGASPIMARLAREQAALTLGLVTLPFEFEGQRRRLQAFESLDVLRSEADAVITVPNDRLFKMVESKAKVAEAFSRADAVLAQAVEAVVRLVSRNGLINLDFADLKAVLKKPRAETVFGIGEGRGENKTEQAISAVFTSPLLEGGTQLQSADAMVVSVVGGPDLTYADVQEAMSRLARRASDHTQIIAGAAIERAMEGVVTLTVIASRSMAGAPVSKLRWVKGTALTSASHAIARTGHTLRPTSSGTNTITRTTPARPDSEPTAQPEANYDPNADKSKSEDIGARHDAGSVQPNTQIFASASLQQDKNEKRDPSSCGDRISAGETGTIGTIELSLSSPLAPRVTGAAARCGTKPSATKHRQEDLPFELYGKGLFNKTEPPTLHNGEDLDIPTFLRRGIKL